MDVGRPGAIEPARNQSSRGSVEGREFSYLHFPIYTGRFIAERDQFELRVHMIQGILGPQTVFTRRMLPENWVLVGQNSCHR